MLNEERVKHMIRLADYEAKGGKEEIKISSHFKKDYIGLNTFLSVVWMTVAYVLFVGGIWLAIRDLITAEITKEQNLYLLILVTGIYLVFLVVYIIKARRFYKRKHARAYHRVKKFKKNLIILEEMYEKEDRDAEDA